MPSPHSDAFANEGGFDVMRYVSLVLERKGLLVLIALPIMFSAIITCYVIPKKYEAESTVFIEQNVISDLVKGIAITPSMEMKIKAIKVTMLSRSMLLNVIKALDLDLNAKTDRMLDGLIASLQQRIRIRLDEKRGVFMISFADADPVLARNVVNTLTRLYIEENTSTKRKESFEATQFLAEQIEVFKKRIDAAEKEIDAYKLEAGVVLSSNEPALRAEIENAEQEMEGVRIRVNALTTSRNLLLSNTPLKRQLEEQEKSLETLLGRYTKNHPRVRQLEAAIAENRRQIRTDGQRELDAVYRSPEYQSIKVELASLENRQKNLQEEIDKNKEIIQKIPGARSQLAELERKRRNETIIYEQLVSRYGRSEVSKEMELQDKAMTFRVLDPAVVPSAPSSPNRPLIILLGIVAGIGLGVGIIILIDLINPSIKTLDDLKEFGIPVLAVVPRVKNEESLALQRGHNRLIYSIGLAGILISLSFFLVETLHLGLVDNVIAKVSTFFVG
ncbi:polysaccharide chain length determinant protein [Pseudodesulfovibrio cashew]|uniref:Polysaccharide chain length determinant protein n=1 Tax=Pseudodesulfovibrio cashew TaxID=2678688 RepID=A0A6I6J9A7_9BACT|nr:XrtA system polysaccharide chain length determinant [Pseudodesulfovibrio cashew]QGY39185.1 polysaccharide chain length determinant protein [Pseudodesulfovibrio cashew]